MKSRLLSSLFFLICAGNAFADDFLWWLIEDDPDVVVDGYGTYKTDAIWLDKNGERLTITDARVHVTGNGSDEYLMITASPGSEPGPSIYFESLPIRMEGVYAYAFDVSPYMSGGSLAAGYSFAIELGNWNNFDDENGWTTMAGHYIPDSEVARHIVESGTFYPENGWYTANPFIASSGVAPEPSSGLLVLIGLSALCLRRRSAV